MATRIDIHPDRVRLLKSGIPGNGPVAYWMSREQRVRDNWALLYAQQTAHTHRVPLVVVFTLAPKFLDATLRQYEFMLAGLEEVESALAKYRIPFVLLAGSPADCIIRFVIKNDIGALVTDFSPLRIHRKWKTTVAQTLSIPFYEVDAHNIVPCWIASSKREFSAATFRPRIRRLLPTFLEEIPTLGVHQFPWQGKLRSVDWKSIRRNLDVDRSVKPVDWILPGENSARKVLRHFIEYKLKHYDVSRNDPTRSAQSNLSPYLHFGQIAAQRVALTVMKETPASTSRDAFLEELIVRRELSDNFCFYESQYDSVAAFPKWGRHTLEQHASDKRPYTYSRTQLEQGKTHDPLWNAAQIEMVRTGKMHGYMRMYWAKKILEWTRSPEDALRIAIYLNDKYELDGRDPNGYTGIAWSIGGLHDRAWGERLVFGKIRSMTFDGCKKKFDIERYIQKVERSR